MKKAAFLDRDGVINQRAREGEYTTTWEELHILPDAARAIGLLKRAGYLVVVVTNQRCVAKGLISSSQLEDLHKRMCDGLSREGGMIDAIYYCPHDFAPPCDCRKPKPGMLLQAAREHNIDLADSWMIGDSARDMGAGKAAGCRTIRLLDEGEAPDADADIVAGSLLEAAQKIIELDERVGSQMTQ
jgi:D-glycero-D-manno-heptose 1,7-bisphosphate phosphatase